ncbi:MAG: hypothetical protein WBC04_18020, partial [Candidatus Acidiferrales bacterium]
IAAKTPSGEQSSSGEEVARDRKEIVVPKWKPHETKTIVLVNASRMWADYVLAAKAIVQVSGESRTRIFPVVRPKVTLLDVLPGLMLQPFPANLRWNIMSRLN